MKKNHTIILSYAEALYEAATEKNALEVVFADMRNLLEAINADTNIIKYLSNPVWDIKDKKTALKELKLNKLSLACLDVIADNNRFANLADILKAFENLYYQKKDIVKVDVKTVMALTSKQDKSLQKNLEQFINKKVVIKYEISPKILGGLLIQFNSQMIDDTLKGKLEHIELLMKGTK